MISVYLLLDLMFCSEEARVLVAAAVFGTIFPFVVQNTLLIFVFFIFFSTFVVDFRVNSSSIAFWRLVAKGVNGTRRRVFFIVFALPKGTIL